jgi:hypothetical protein
MNGVCDGVPRQTRLIARILWSAPGTPSVPSPHTPPSRGAERRQTRERAKLPERLAKPPETPCEGVSSALAIGHEAPPGAPLAAFCVPLSRASGRRPSPQYGPHPERWPSLLRRRQRAAIQGSRS